jgi:hypothetical protein
VELRETNTPLGSSSFELLVLTRRSLHIFQPKSFGSLRIPPAHYSVYAAKDKLKQLLERPPPEPVPEQTEEAFVMKTDTVVTPDIVVVDTPYMDVNETDREVELAATTMSDEKRLIDSMEEFVAIPLADPSHGVSTSSTEPNDVTFSKDEDPTIPQAAAAVDLGQMGSSSNSMEANGTSGNPQPASPMEVDETVTERTSDGANEGGEENWILIDTITDETLDATPETDNPSPQLD